MGLENYTESLFLPFLRLKLIILRPDFVFMRLRNPEVRTFFKRLPRNVLSVIFYAIITNLIFLNRVFAPGLPFRVKHDEIIQNLDKNLGFYLSPNNDFDIETVTNF